MWSIVKWERNLNIFKRPPSCNFLRNQRTSFILYSTCAKKGVNRCWNFIVSFGDAGYAKFLSSLTNLNKCEFKTSVNVVVTLYHMWTLTGINCIKKQVTINIDLSHLYCGTCQKIRIKRKKCLLLLILSEPSTSLL